MIKKYGGALLIFLVIFIGYAQYEYRRHARLQKFLEESEQDSIISAKTDMIDGNRVACTMEAKLCPDGSAVGRVGPNCEFATCPE